MKKPKPGPATVLLPDGPTMIERYSAKIVSFALPLPLPAAHLSTRIRCEVLRQVAQSGACTVTINLTYLLLHSVDASLYGHFDFRAEYHVLARWPSLRPADRSTIVASAFAMLGQAIAALDLLADGLPACSYIPTHQEALSFLKGMRTRRTPLHEMHVLDGMHLIPQDRAKPDAVSNDALMDGISFPLPASFIGEGIPRIEIDYM